MGHQVDDDLVEKIIELGQLIVDFSKIERAVHLDMNGTVETDTDHSVMLAVIGCALAAKLESQLDLGKVAQYALIHDLVETYAGDVNTINFHTVDGVAKARAEQAALKHIKQQFGDTFPWLHETIEAYESLAEPEARFIKTLDKAMPTIGHIFADNYIANEHFDDAESFEYSVNAHSDQIKATYGKDQANAREVRNKLLKRIIDRKYEYHKNKSKKT